MSALPSHLYKAFVQSAQAQSAKPAVWSCGSQSPETLSYGDLLTRVLHARVLLKDITCGDAVILILDNGWQFPVFFFALQSLGATAVLVDAQYDSEHVQSIARHSGARMIISGQKKVTDLRAVMPEESIAFLSADGEESLACLLTATRPDLPSVNHLDGDATAVLFYTSGTTDAPKGVVLTHHNLLANVTSIQQLGLVNASDSVLAFLPLHHAYAFTVTLLTPLLLGAAVVFPRGMSSADLMGCMRQVDVSIFVGVPQVFALIHRSVADRLKKMPAIARGGIGLLGRGGHVLRTRLGWNANRLLFGAVHRQFGKRLRFMVSGGARLAPEITRAFEFWGFTMLEGYGLTETAPVAAFNPAKQPKAGSVGKPVAGVSIKILDPDEKGIGEVLIRGANVMPGYHKQEDETAKVIRDGWFHSGDLGYFDEDGYLFLEGRKKELIVLSNGKNIDPNVVEQHYGRNPFIKEIGVLTVAGGEGALAGEQLVAVIVGDEQHFRQHNEANMRERLTWELENLSAQLPSYQRIKGFVINQEALPRTRLGKLMRYRLPDIYRNNGRKQTEAKGASPDEGEATGGARDAALAFLEKTFNRPVRLEDHLELDLGLDSLGRIELLLNLQEHLGLELDDDAALAFYMCNTVQDLQDCLHKYLPENQESRSGEEGGIRWGDILAQGPSPDTRSRIKLSFGVGDKIFNLVLITLFKLLFKLCFFLRVEGRAHLPEKGPYLICPNHTSYFDGLFVLCALPYKVALQTYFVGLSQFFENKALRPFARTARLIPLEMSYNMVEALKACGYVLQNGKAVCYFPEGQRSIDGELKEFKKGVGILVTELKIPVVPVYLEGAYKTWGRGQKGPRFSPVRVRIGEAFTPAPAAGASPEENYEHSAQSIREAVARLKTS